MFLVGIIGCGLIGGKRAAALGADGKLIACADVNIDRARGIAQAHSALAFDDWRDLIKLSELDIVVVSTLHDSLSEITRAAIMAGKHVFVEKPAGRSAAEIKDIIAQENHLNVKVRVGFNHRYHRAIIKAREIVDAGQLGDLMYIRARYGHGGRVGYDREWRADPTLSGGGELIDQGPHLIDLSRWFLGEFTDVQGFANTYYWDMPVDDNAFMILKTKTQQVAFLQVSCTEWKNLFSMEIYGTSGKLDISGLGGSYGVEKITHYRMLPEMGPPETQAWEFPMTDNSWEMEIKDFYNDITQDREPKPGLNDAVTALEIIDKIYMESGYDYCSKPLAN